MADKEQQPESQDGKEKQPASWDDMGERPPSRLDGVSGVLRIENPDPEMWTRRSITSGQFSKSKKEDGPYRGTRLERW